jgi:putative ATPase
MTTPLANAMRPQTLDEVVGQPHLLGEKGILPAVVRSGALPNLIFYGPSGVGKTTVARIIAGAAGRRLHRLNGTTASTADIKEVIAELDTLSGRAGLVLYLDEIQYLNKKQQQTLLEFIEDGSITLIASTTENPYFYIYNAILSRSTVLEFKPVSAAEVRPVVDRAFVEMGRIHGVDFAIEPEVADYVAAACGGDVRKAINTVEMLGIGALPEGRVTLESARLLAQRSSMRYDRDGDAHYDILSAFQKSIRGSDENAALHYLARLLEAGDLISACRRLMVIACEDIGLAYPQAIAVVKACVDMANQLGLPEAALPLGDAVVLLCTAPKSNSGALGIWAAMADVKAGNYGDIPDHLKDSHYAGAKKLGRGQGYKYAHDYPGHYVRQQYLPDNIKDKVYYRFGENKTEQAAAAYRKRLLESTKD